MIKLFLMDVDGCLTDGCYYVWKDAHFCDINTSKKFNTRDFHGIDKLLKSGVKAAVISRANSGATEAQFERFPGVNVHMGIQRKADLIKTKYLDKYSMDEIAFIGDDEPDIELLSMVGWAACPLDAEPDVKSAVSNLKEGLVLTRRGGQGCVREFIDEVLKYNASVRFKEE